MTQDRSPFHRGEKEIQQRLGDRRGVVDSLVRIGEDLLSIGEDEEARKRLDRAVAIARERPMRSVATMTT